MVRARILKTLDRIIIQGQAPRATGHVLVGEWTGYWRYRIGDWRVIARIEDAQVLVVVVTIGYRSGVYR